MLAARVIGGGHNPNHSGDAVRNLRDITDEPSTTIAAQLGGGAGNAGPFVESRAATHLMVDRGAGLEQRHGVRGGTVDEPAKAVRCEGQGGLRLESRAGSEPGRLDSPAPCVTAQEVKGTRGDNMGKQLASGGKSGGVDRASDGLWLATGRRRLTPTECATLQDFPPDHPWQGNKTAQYRQVGNAVPPRLAQAAAEAVLRADDA